MRRYHMNDPVDMVRQNTGLNKGQWARFNKIVHDEGQNLCDRLGRSLTWPNVPFNEQIRVLEAVNTRLVREGIPEVEMSALRWRMSTSLKRIKPKVSGEGSAAINQATASSKSLPYDPIRDS
ncbi:hypothetical protein BU24DRAFT_421265 [Aaosphaeria arxii CBS 175.79]|uniref:Uncharacterized protein n=1 Tax=Aaosphaeria arxii CBS 175.79 TaxID=1450172 RepID=A0A6A5XZ86_9PLEO|nr:uncharacterized protein BU24DRAFT_421265 [Aaosphaeria arxii CBS 175.79]KAF2018279.1 hypothetical protein BU24DRAFT_421265 [Aaosphaeria arxii CBS 175.79]